LVEASPKTVSSSKKIVVTPATEKKYVVFEATVSTGETVTIGEMASVAYAKCCKVADGTDVTCTIATNVITITQASLTDASIIGWAYGA
jgi:hypothetical protein